MPSFQATLPGKPDQMSPIRAAVPTETTATGVPSGSKPECSSYFHTTDNRLVDGASGTELANEVEKVGRSAYNGSVERTPLTITSRTC